VAPRYKFVELSVVTEETLERAVNEWVGQGWAFDGIRFVTGEASRRPQMAFVSFVRDDGARDAPPVPERSTLRRKHNILELGELDPGEIEPFEADLDWENAVTRPGTPAAQQQKGSATSTGTGRRGKGKKRA